jgi:hypothetical protein
MGDMGLKWPPQIVLLVGSPSLVRLRQIFSSLFTLLVRALPPSAKWNHSFAVGQIKNVQYYDQTQ